MADDAHPEAVSHRAQGRVITSLRNVASLITAILVLQLGQGLLGVQIPLKLEAEGAPRSMVGLAAAVYSAGYMIGAWRGSVLIARIGHIRVFSAGAAIAAATTLAFYAAHDVFGWLALRAIAGAVIAVMFAAVESWMSGSIAPTERGGVLGLYQVGVKAAIAAGPFLAFGYGLAAPEPWMIAAGVLALCLVPVCFTTRMQPEPPKGKALALRAQFRTAPAAVIGCFGAGLINTGVMALAPLYASAQFGPQNATGFYAAAWAGSLLLQWPAGRLSDFVDRRNVIVGLNVLAAAAAFALAMLAGHAPFWLAAALFAVWGAGALSFYGVAVAHMADRAEPAQMAQASSGLLFVWAAGSVAGPLMLGPVGDLMGPEGVFWFAGASAVALCLAMFWRRAVRTEPAQASKGPFSVNEATSVAAAESAHGEDAA